MEPPGLFLKVAVWPIWVIRVEGPQSWRWPRPWWSLRGCFLTSGTMRLVRVRGKMNAAVDLRLQWRFIQQDQRSVSGPVCAQSSNLNLVEHLWIWKWLRTDAPHPTWGSLKGSSKNRCAKGSEYFCSGYIFACIPKNLFSLCHRV